MSFPDGVESVLSGGVPMVGVERRPPSSDTHSLQVSVDESLANTGSDLEVVQYSPVAVYSGSDLRVLIEPAVSVRGRQTPRQLIELTTITVSVHREKAPVRACGYINPKGFARGRRTIAGTMVLTQFHVDALYRFLSGIQNSDLSRDSYYTKPDQLPAFHLLMLFSNEAGFTSWRRLMGVEVLTEGTVYSVHDMYAEQTLTYIASDFTPLVPISEPGLLPKAPQFEPTPKSVIAADPGVEA